MYPVHLCILRQEYPSTYLQMEGIQRIIVLT